MLSESISWLGEHIAAFSLTFQKAELEVGCKHQQCVLMPFSFFLKCGMMCPRPDCDHGDEDPYSTGERQERERVGQEWPQDKAKTIRDRI